MHLLIVHVLLVPVIQILDILLSIQEHKKCDPEPNRIHAVSVSQCSQALLQSAPDLHFEGL